MRGVNEPISQRTGPFTAEEITQEVLENIRAVGATEPRVDMVRALLWPLPQRGARSLITRWAYVDLRWTDIDACDDEALLALIRPQVGAVWPPPGVEVPEQKGDAESSSL